jgi:hypothetical protein
LSTALSTWMTGISLHMQWPLTSQLHGSILKENNFFCYGSSSTPIKLHAHQTPRPSNSTPIKLHAHQTLRPSNPTPNHHFPLMIPVYVVYISQSLFKKRRKNMADLYSYQKRVRVRKVFVWGVGKPALRSWNTNK